MIAQSCMWRTDYKVEEENLVNVENILCSDHSCFNGIYIDTFDT